MVIEERAATQKVLQALRTGHCMQCNRLYPQGLIKVTGEYPTGYGIECGVCGLSFSPSEVETLLEYEKEATENLVKSTLKWKGY